MLCGVKALKVALPSRDVKPEGGRQRHPSGGVSAKEMVIGLEGVELGADGKVRNCVCAHVCYFLRNIETSCVWHQL